MLDAVNVHKLTVTALFEIDLFKKAERSTCEWPAVRIFCEGKLVFQLLMQFKRDVTEFCSVPAISWEASRYSPSSCVPGRNKNCCMWDENLLQFLL